MSGSNSIKSVNQLLSVLKKDPDLESKIKSDPINALEEIKSAAVPATDPRSASPNEPTTSR